MWSSSCEDSAVRVVSPIVLVCGEKFRVILVGLSFPASFSGRSWPEIGFLLLIVDVPPVNHGGF